MLGSIQTKFWTIRDYVSPVLRDSKFKETGRITPEEFVAAGDFLHYKFPTWEWHAGDPKKARSFLPPDKQYLVSRNVPCLRRAAQLEYGALGDEDAEVLMSFANEAAAASNDDNGSTDGDDAWVTTHMSSTSAAHGPQEIPDMPVDEIPDMDEIPDIEDEDNVPQAPTGAGAGPSSNIVQVRTYDCYITYDKYYQTPRMWLLGYDEAKRPLPPTSAFEDVSADHAHKTVTIEPFPHSSISLASVHPCKHASIMRKVMERMNNSVLSEQRKEKEKDKSRLFRRDKKKEDDDDVPGLRVDQYLVVFLKFMASIVPTIEVDATTGM